MTFSCPATLLLLSAITISPCANGASPAKIPQCNDVTLHASYLAEEKPGEGAGFFLAIENHRSAPIAIADPAPLGVDWYTAKGAAWLWRASSGNGGSLVNALHPNGLVFAMQGKSTAEARQTRSIAPHASYSWAVFSKGSPDLLYRPGCEHCGYVSEDQFHAVVTYAYLPEAGAQTTPAMLRCGLRSEPVVMPRLADSQKK